MRDLYYKLTYSFIISSAFMHLLCCGLPLLLSAANIATMVGVVGAGVAHSQWFEQVEVTVLVASGMMLAISIALQLISNRIDCRTDGACVHRPCDNKKTLSQRVLTIAVALYVLNLTLFFLAH